MTIYSILFYLLAALIVTATTMTVLSRHLVHGVVFLVVSFLGTAMLFYLLGAPMIAALEVILYAGAIMVLFLIVVMVMADEKRKGPLFHARQVLFIIGTGGVSFSLTLFFLLTDPGHLAGLRFAALSPRDFGHIVFSRYWAAVEIVSFLLFVALVGAYYLGRESREMQKEGGTP